MEVGLGGRPRRGGWDLKFFLSPYFLLLIGIILLKDGVPRWEVTCDGMSCHVTAVYMLRCGRHAYIHLTCPDACMHAVTVVSMSVPYPLLSSAQLSRVKLGLSAASRQRQLPRYVSTVLVATLSLCYKIVLFRSLFRELLSIDKRWLGRASAETPRGKKLNRWEVV